MNCFGSFLVSKSSPSILSLIKISSSNGSICISEALFFDAETIISFTNLIIFISSDSIISLFISLSADAAKTEEAAEVMPVVLFCGSLFKFKDIRSELSAFIISLAAGYGGMNTN